jgi:hypothetical protein
MFRMRFKPWSSWMKVSGVANKRCWVEGSYIIWVGWGVGGGGIRSTHRLVPVLLTLSLTLIGFHIMHTVRIEPLALQAAAWAGERRLGCLYEQTTRRRQRVDGRSDVHGGVSPDRQSLGIHMLVPLRLRRGSPVQRNSAVHDVTT